MHSTTSKTCRQGRFAVRRNPAHRSGSRFPSRSGRRGAITGPVLLGLVLSMLVAAWNGAYLFMGGSHAPTLATDVVIRGPLHVSITERGDLESTNNTTLRHAVEHAGGLTILKIVEEGSWVEKGDIVAVLDSSKLVAQAQYNQIWMYYHEAFQKTAEARLAIQKMSNESTVAAAEHQLRMAQLDLEKYLNADYVQKKHRILGEISMAEENFVTARDRLASEKHMFRKGFTTVNELSADQFAVTKTQLLLDRAREKLHILEEFTHQRELADRQARVRRNQREADQVKLRTEIALGQRQLEALYGKRWAAYFRNLYEAAQRRVDACTIRAPRAGVVVYANAESGASGSLIYEGARVWEGQAIVRLPDIRQMQVQARIHESKILQVHEGLSATIQVDARGGASYEGIVAKVSPVPLSASWPNMNLKEYATIIRIQDTTGEASELKPGMTAQVTIHADPLPDALQVPAAVCVERGDRHFVWVVDEHQAVTRREVQIGASNDSAVQIVTGLGEGEHVVSHPRTDLPEELDRLYQEIPARPSIPPDITPEHNPEMFWDDPVEPTARPTGNEPDLTIPQTGSLSVDKVPAPR